MARGASASRRRSRPSRSGGQRYCRRLLPPKIPHRRDPAVAEALTPRLSLGTSSVRHNGSTPPSIATRHLIDLRKTPIAASPRRARRRGRRCRQPGVLRRFDALTAPCSLTSAACRPAAATHVAGPGRHYCAWPRIPHFSPHRPAVRPSDHHDRSMSHVDGSPTACLHGRPPSQRTGVRRLRGGVVQHVTRFGHHLYPRPVLSMVRTCPEAAHLLAYIGGFALRRKGRVPANGTGFALTDGGIVLHVQEPRKVRECFPTTETRRAGRRPSRTRSSPSRLWGSSPRGLDARAGAGVRILFVARADGLLPPGTPFPIGGASFSHHPGRQTTNIFTSSPARVVDDLLGTMWFLCLFVTTRVDRWGACGTCLLPASVGGPRAASRLQRGLSIPCLRFRRDQRRDGAYRALPRVRVYSWCPIGFSPSSTPSGGPCSSTGRLRSSAAFGMMGLSRRGAWLLLTSRLRRGLGTVKIRRPQDFRPSRRAREPRRVAARCEASTRQKPRLRLGASKVGGMGPLGPHFRRPPPRVRRMSAGGCV